MIQNSELAEIAKNSTYGSSSMVNINTLNLGVTDGQFHQLIKLFSRLVPSDQHNDDGVAEIEDYLRSLEPGPVLNNKKTMISSIFDSLNRRPLTELRDVCFPSLRTFDKEARDAISKYRGHISGTVLASLDLKERLEIQAWAGNTESQLLWINGCLDPGEPTPWSTDLSLEVIAAASDAIQQSKCQDMTVVYHFCGPSVDGVKHTSAIVVQDWIYQLIGNKGQVITRNDCQNYMLTEGRFLDAARLGYFAELWKLFLECLIVTKVRSLVIVLSDFDSMFCSGNQDKIGRNELQEFQESLAKLITFKRILIKIFVTSKPSIEPDFPSTQTLQQTQHTRIELAHPPARYRQTTRHARKFRAPIEAGPLAQQPVGEHQGDTTTENLRRPPTENSRADTRSMLAHLSDEEEDSEVDFPTEEDMGEGFIDDSESEREEDIERARQRQQEEAAQLRRRRSLNRAQASNTENVYSSEEEISYSDIEQSFTGLREANKEDPGSTVAALEEDFADMVTHSDSDD